MAQTTTRLALVKPDTGSENWEAKVSNWADKLDQTAAQFLVFHLGGEAIDEEVLFDDFLFDEAVKITRITLYARVGPEGDALEIDFLKNGVEQNKLGVINIGAQSGSITLSGLSFDPNAVPPEKMGLKVKKVGSTESGAEVTLVVHYHIKPAV